MADFTQHWVKSIKAKKHDYPFSPIMLKLCTEYSSMPTEITLYLGNDELTAALVKAINDVAAAHKAGAVETEAT